MADSGGALFAARHGSMPPRFPVLCGDDPGAVCASSSPAGLLDYRGKIATRWRAVGYRSGYWAARSPVGFRYRVRQPVLGVPFAFTPQLHVDYFGTFWQLILALALLRVDY